MLFVYQEIRGFLEVVCNTFLEHRVGRSFSCPLNVPALDFSLAGTFAAVATVLETGIQGASADPFWATATVTFNATNNSYDLVGGTTGNSPNVVKGLERARETGAITVGMTGQKENKIEKIAYYCLKIPSIDTPRIQEGHITVGHIICYLVEKELFD